MKRLSKLLGKKSGSGSPRPVGTTRQIEAVPNLPSLPPPSDKDPDTGHVISSSQSAVTNRRDEDESSHLNAESNRSQGGMTAQALESNIINAGRDVIIAATAGASRRRDSMTDMRKLADWLTPLNFHAVHKDIYEKVTPGTGSWIFEHEAYLEWISQESGTLWGTGMPGAGKTCLASVVVQHLMELPTSTVVYVYCQYKEELTTPQILSSLLKQLVEASDSAARYIEANLYASCKRTNTNPTKSELLKALQHVVGLFPRVFAVIDALDELGERVREELVGALLPLQVSLFMTSRHLVLSQLDTPDFEIRAPSNDFRAFIESQLNTLPKLKRFLNPETSAAMISKIEHKSEGMFLLAALQLAALSTKGVTNSLSLKNTVDQLPATLDEMYELTLNRIQRQSEEEQALARRALLCVIFAARFLEVGELLEVLATDLATVTFDEQRRTDETVLLSVCLGLLTVEKESGTVHLIHYTAQEFLEGQNVLPFTNAHTFMSNISAIYLSLSHPDFHSIASHADLKEVESSHPFFSYAIRNLGYHTHLAISSFHDGLPEHVSQLFNHHSPVLLLPTVDGIEYLDYGNIIHFAALYGLTSVLENNIQSPGQGAKTQSSPLFYACLGGDISIVQMLILNHQCAMNSEFGATTFHVAAEHGYTSIINLLLNASNAAGAMGSTSKSETHLATLINVKLPIFGKTALYLACEQGHHPVVQLLLGYKEIGVNASNSQGWTPLHVASFNGHTSVVQLLLNTPGIDVNSKQKVGVTALFAASQNGHEPVVQLLLSTPGIDVNAKAEYGITALYIASQNGHEPVVQLLLSTPGIDVNAQQDDGRTTLYTASGNGHKPVVQLLLSTPGIDVNAKENTGETALYIASWVGHEPVVQLLLSTPGIDVNAKKSTGATALFIASQVGHEPVVQLLLHAPGIDINAATRTGATAFYIASQQGHKPVLQLLLSQDGVDINAKASGQARWTPLYGASALGHTEVVRFLLGCPGVDVHAKTKGAFNGCPANETALQAAQRQGHTGVVDIFKEMGFDSTD